METFLALIMTPLMAAEILAGEYMIARCFERRNYFYLRFFGSAAVCVLLTVWIELVYYLITGEQFNYGTSAEAADIYFKIFYYIIIFGMTIFCVWFSFKQSFILIIVCCSTGYAIQHIASSAGMLLSVATEGLPSPWLYVAEAASWLATRAAVYGTVFAMQGLCLGSAIRWGRALRRSHGDRRRPLWVFGAVWGSTAFIM